MQAPKWQFPLQQSMVQLSTGPLYLGSLPARPADQYFAILALRPPPEHKVRSATHPHMGTAADVLSHSSMLVPADQYVAILALRALPEYKGRSATRVHICTAAHCLVVGKLVTADQPCPMFQICKPRTHLHCCICAQQLANACDS